MPGVGDVETEWHSEWSFSTPLGSTWGPDSAYEGGLIAVTAVDQDYGNNNRQFLSSPVLDLSEGGLMLMLSTRRWLTVEDSIYDVARVWAGSTELWRNPGSPGGQEHTLDDAWVQHNILLDDRLDDLGEVQFHWTLQTDPGLEFGGWALDDVCVVALDDVEGHYRVKDLSASVDLPEIQLAWTQPWVQPLLGTVLVRRAGGPPLNPLDGDEIERDDAPRPGEARTLIDGDVEVGVDYHYALFVTGPRADDVSEGRVLGEDLAIGRAELVDDSGLPADTGAGDYPVDTGTMGNPGDDSGAAPASDSAESSGSVSRAPEGPKTGCGCSAPGAQGGNGRTLFWLSVLAALLRRRTQRPAPEL
jgi:MYXO-CTERM domain-containing protein